MNYYDACKEADREALELDYPEPTHYTEDLRPTRRVRTGTCPIHGRVSAYEHGGDFICLMAGCHHTVEVLPDDQQWWQRLNL